ncbi:MAG: hypothetical protein J1F20_01865 [Muribaculaceae bacterium]|nr:hypothetical protein [Muribaculaceae bacterium]
MKSVINLNRIIIAVTAICASVISPSCNNDDVIIDDQPDSTGQRPVTPQSSAWCDKVYEWTPAPGQFINEKTPDCDWNDKTTPAIAAQWAKNRLDKHLYVSLGSFGGYIVVGFDHSILNTGGYEIGVLGNAFNSPSGSSNEPGIVYVMQDSNNNGLPDDEWFELKGSDTFAPTTIRNYSVTYYRPEADEKAVCWIDNLGNEGEIGYLGMFHSQPSYYPVWIRPDSYTLTGTRLMDKTSQNPETGNWQNDAFAWGYCDNMGQDNIELDNFTNCNRFKISNAIDESGNPVNLQYIDFVKIQTAILASAGWLGEVSSEVLGVVDLSLIKQ